MFMFPLIFFKPKSNESNENSKEYDSENKSKEPKGTKAVIEELIKMNKKAIEENEKKLFDQLIKEKKEQLQKEEEEEQKKNKNQKKLIEEVELNIKLEEDKKRQEEELKQMKVIYRQIFTNNFIIIITINNISNTKIM